MGNNVNAFERCGATILVAADATAPTGAPTTSVGMSGIIEFRLYNAGAATVFYAHGSTAAEATANAAIPTGSGGSAKNASPIGAGSTEVVSAPRDSYWSGITAALACSLYVTPGKGI